MEPVILSSEKAVAWLKDYLQDAIEAVYSGDIPVEGFGEYAEDVLDMVEAVQKWEAVKIFEHPMSTSGICVNELVVGEGRA